MSNKRAPGRSLDEWMELVTECRQSGLTDAAWCNEHGMSERKLSRCGQLLLFLCVIYRENDENYRYGEMFMR